MSPTKVLSLDDDPNAISAIGDDYQSLYYDPIDQSVGPLSTISSERFMKPVYYTGVPGLVSRDSDYESNSIADRSEDSRDSGYGARFKPLARDKMLLDNPTSLECFPPLSSHTPYVVETDPHTASSIKNSIRHDMGEDDKEFPSSTSLGSVRDVQDWKQMADRSDSGWNKEFTSFKHYHGVIALEPGITHGESTSQSVNPGYGHNGLNPNKIERPSTVSADVEHSKMTITGEHGVQDTIEPEKIISEPDNEARASILDPSAHTWPLMSSLSLKWLKWAHWQPLKGYNHGSDDLQDDVVSFVNGSLCSHLACIYRLIDQADANIWKTLLGIAVPLNIQQMPQWLRMARKRASQESRLSLRKISAAIRSRSSLQELLWIPTSQA